MKTGWVDTANVEGQLMEGDLIANPIGHVNMVLSSDPTGVRLRSMSDNATIKFDYRSYGAMTKHWKGWKLLRTSALSGLSPDHDTLVPS